MNLVLFDFDGTITSSDSFSAFVKYSVSKRRLMRGYLFLAPFIIGYRLGLVSGTQLRQRIVRIGYKGETAAWARRMGEAYAREVIPGMIREEALTRIQWHLERGDQVVVVSASLDLYLEPWCKKYGLDLICSRLEAVDERLTGLYDQGDCTAGEKKARVLAAYDLKKYARVYAYGDTDEDRDLLQLADVKYFRWKKISHDGDQGS